MFTRLTRGGDTNTEQDNNLITLMLIMEDVEKLPTHTASGQQYEESAYKTTLNILTQDTTKHLDRFSISAYYCTETLNTYIV